MKLPAVARRTLLIGGGAGVGLVVAFLAWPRRESSPLRPGADERVFGPFLRIATDGSVTLAVPQVETGQGIWTGLAQIAADELGADWERMAVEPSPSGTPYANMVMAHDYGVKMRITAGSSSMRAFAQPLREAAATARSMLCEAAADRWGVSAAECDTQRGFVVHEGKQIGFGEVASEAARVKPPDTPRLRPASSGKLAGTPLQRLDLPAKSDGSWRFASDIRLPKMLYASVRVAPPGGRVASFSREAAKRQRGLIDIVGRNSWVAALGDTWWAADQGLTHAAVKFSAPQASELAGEMTQLLEGGDAEPVFVRGDYDSSTGGSTSLAASYSIAATPHYALEPPSAVARYRGDRLEVWIGTQVPDLARTVAAKSMGLPEKSVTIYPMPVGDASGSAFSLDAAAIAAKLAKHSGRPVNLSYPPATAQNQDMVRAPLAARLKALPSPDGTLRSWYVRVVGMPGLHSALAAARGTSAPDFAPQNIDPPYGIAAVRAEAVDAALLIRTGYMRGGEESMLCFATESFVDEIAREIGAEPLAFRIGLLGGSPRLARAIMMAARIGGWDGGAPGSSSMGLACASLYGSHIGLLAEASIGTDQRISVSRLVAAVDAGQVVNPGLVRQQIEGGLLAALAVALIPTPPFVANMPKAVAMRDEGFGRLANVPTVEVELIRSEAAPGGVSGLGMAVLAPAVANAIAAATGQRLRNLPFDPMSG